MKKINWLCLGLIIVLAAGCALACDNTKPPEGETREQMKNSVDAAMDAVTLSVNITENIELPATSGTVAISWDSDKKDVISNTGVVVRPTFGEDEEEVKLTGSFSYKDHSDTKVYTVSVKPIHEKVFSFAGGYTGDNAIFVAPESGEYGSVTDKGDGVISLKPTEEEGRKNGPYFKMSNHMPAWKGNGFTSEVMVYLDHEEMRTGGNTFIIDCSVNDKEGDWVGGIYLTFAANDNNVVITQSQSDNDDMFAAATGWYIVGTTYSEKNGKLSAKSFVKNADGAEVHSWTNDRFKSFSIPETTGDYEDVAISLIGSPRSLWFTDMNIAAIDVKKVILSYNVV